MTVAKMEFCGMFRMNCVPEGKTARVPLMSFFLLSLVLSLSGCIEFDKEKPSASSRLRVIWNFTDVSGLMVRWIIMRSRQTKNRTTSLS